MYDGKSCSLAQPECLGVTWFFAVVMTRSVPDHCISKASPDCTKKYACMVDGVNGLLSLHIMVMTSLYSMLASFWTLDLFVIDHGLCTAKTQQQQSVAACQGHGSWNAYSQKAAAVVSHNVHPRTASDCQICKTWRCWLEL
jgi:hypothetical protein